MCNKAYTIGLKEGFNGWWERVEISFLFQQLVVFITVVVRALSSRYYGTLLKVSVTHVLYYCPFSAEEGTLDFIIRAHFSTSSFAERFSFTFTLRCADIRFLDEFLRLFYRQSARGNRRWLRFIVGPADIAIMEAKEFTNTIVYTCQSQPNSNAWSNRLYTRI